MTLANRFCMMSLCVGCLLGVGALLHTVPVSAQQSTQPPNDDGVLYINAYVDVDQSYNLYVDTYLETDYDEEDLDYIELDAQVHEDSGLIDHGEDPGEDPAELKASYGVVPTGHTYQIDAQGYACFDDEDGGGDGGGDDDDCDRISTYASVYVQSPPPLITSISPPNFTQGDQGTNFTIVGSNFIENSTDQLTLNVHGGSNPFTLINAPSTCTSSCTATFSYDFSGYPAGTYTLSLSNNEGESDYKSFTVTASSAETSQTFPADTCAVTSSPKVGFTSIVSTGTASSGGTLSVSFSGAPFSKVNPTIAYGASSTPASIASNVAALVSSKYLQYGVSAKAFGPYIIYQGVSPLGVISHSFTDSSFSTTATSTTASAASMACYALPKLPCLGLWPDYDTARTYRSEGVTETPRRHIIRRHISNTPSAGPPPITVYANTIGATPDQLFSVAVQNYNFHTVLEGHPGSGGGIDYTFKTRTVNGVTFGIIGTNAAGADLQTNHFVLSNDRCSVVTSYPIVP